MADKIQLRRDTAANWTAANPVLAAGETGLITENGKVIGIKYGDGVTEWSNIEDFRVNTKAVIPMAWMFDNTVVQADPTAGYCNFNNADLSQVTEAAFSNITELPFDASFKLTNSRGQAVLIVQEDDSDKFIFFTIDTVTILTGYHRFTITVLDSGFAFDDGAILITSFESVIAASSSGGHTIQDKDNINKPQEAVLKYKGKVVAESGKTTIVPRIEDSEDFDSSNMSASDVLQRNAGNTGFEPASTMPDIRILPAVPVANITGANATHIDILTLWLRGRTLTAWLTNQTANAITGVVITNGINNLHTPVDLAAYESKWVSFNMQYCNSSDDIDLYAYATTWNSGSITFKHTQIEG